MYIVHSGKWVGGSKLIYSILCTQGIRADQSKKPENVLTYCGLSTSVLLSTIGACHVHILCSLITKQGFIFFLCRMPFACIMKKVETTNHRQVSPIIILFDCIPHSLSHDFLITRAVQSTQEMQCCREKHPLTMVPSIPVHSFLKLF